MVHPLHFLTSPTYRAKHALTRLALLSETFWAAAAPAVAVAVAAVAAGLLEVPQQLGAVFGGVVHAGLLLLVAAAFLWTVRFAVTRFHIPSDAQVRRRLESASSLTHRPLTAVSDRLANGADPRSRALWAVFQSRALPMSRLRIGAPRPVLPYSDLFAVRAALGVLLVVALAVGWQQPGDRLRAAVTPDFSTGSAAGPASLDLWISAPAYTGKPPVLLQRKTGPTEPDHADDSDANAGQATIPVPVGSRILAAVTGGTGRPSLVIEREGGSDETHEFETLDNDSHRLEVEIENGLGLTVRQGDAVLSHWTIAVIPDLFPTVTFLEPPATTRRASLLLHYSATDDYGVSTAAAAIRRLAANGATTDDEPLILRIMVPNSGKPAISGRSFNDLTAHPWAGQPVQVILEAVDERGQTGRSAPQTTILPERQFRDPIARAVIAQRKRLVTEPANRADIANAVLTLAARPQHYGHDVVVFLALKSSATRLLLQEKGTADRSVVDLLWDTALRIEEGDVATALRQLRDLERQLQDALANDASSSQIEQLMDQLEQAVERYLEAMARNGPEQTEAGPPQDRFNQSDLHDMIDQIRDTARGGAREQAREMLSRLQEMMENLQAGSTQMSRQQSAIRDMMNQLGAMGRAQQELMDRTYRRQQSPENGGDEGRNAGPSTGRGATEPLSSEALARIQEALRRQLGDYMRRLSENFDRIPAPFGQAERQMKRAVDALEQGQPGGAIDPQAAALDALREGAGDLADLLSERFGAGQNVVEGMRPGEGLGQDPLHPRRQGVGYFNDEDIDIPTDSDVNKTRKIIDELRRRSGDQRRPRLEREYIDRLLRRF